MEDNIQFSRMLKPIIKMYIFEKLFATHLISRDGTWLKQKAYTFGPYPRNTLYAPFTNNVYLFENMLMCMIINDILNNVDMPVFKL